MIMNWKGIFVVKACATLLKVSSGISVGLSTPIDFETKIPQEESILLDFMIQFNYPLLCFKLKLEIKATYFRLNSKLCSKLFRLSNMKTFNFKNIVEHFIFD